MRRLTHCIVFLLCVLFLSSPTLHAGTAPMLGQIPLRFEENRGQADATARYVARGSGGVLLFCDHEIAIAVPQSSGVGESGASRSIVRLSFPGSNPQSVPVAENLAPGVSSISRDRMPRPGRRAFRPIAASYGPSSIRELIWSVTARAIGWSTTSSCNPEPIRG